MSHKELHVLPGLQAWCESNDVTILECHIRNVVLENVLFLTYSNSLNSLCNSKKLCELAKQTWNLLRIKMIHQ